MLGWGRWGSQRLSSPRRPPRVECKPSLPHPPLGPSESQRTLRCVPSNSGWFSPRRGKCHSCHLSQDSLHVLPVPVRVGCLHKVPQIRVACKQCPVSDSSGGCMLEIRVTAQLGSGGSPLSSCCALTWWEEGGGACWGPFYKGPDPIHESCTLMT